MVRLPGHEVVSLASVAPSPPVRSADGDAINLTVVLARDDEPAFQRYLRDVYDPSSADYRRFLAPDQVSQRFGPSETSYQLVLTYLQAHGFEVASTSPNRLTVDVRAGRSVTEQALLVHLVDYRVGGRDAYATDVDPALPADVAPHVRFISGLSNLAKPQPTRKAVVAVFCAAVAYETSIFAYGDPDVPQGSPGQQLLRKNFWNCYNTDGKAPIYQSLPAHDPPPPAWQGADGTGQTIGLLEFDAFRPSDVSDYLEATGLPANLIDNVSRIHVNGGAGSVPGADEDEVLLDIDDVISLASGAHIAVYDAPFSGPGTSFQSMFNAMLNGGVTIISNSWTYCEDQTSQADVDSIDAILQTAAASGISVFNGSGDNGSSCLDGAANTIGVPADSPHATAVGGTSLVAGTGFTYGEETWWDGSADTPPTGQGGYGVSRFFARPAYQDGLTASPMRSIPDVVAVADPVDGVMICAADLGGCPTGLIYGGTSSSTPLWAAFAALLNQTQGANLGALNPQMYALAAGNAFHAPALLDSDFAHVGLGSPRLAMLHQALTQQTAGPVSASVSSVVGYGEGNFTVPLTLDLPLPSIADGITNAYVVVRLADGNGNVIPGKTVSLQASSGSHATISPVSGVSDIENGAVVFGITDLVAEDISFSATDTSDSLPLESVVHASFGVPSAASGSIIAFTDAVPADGQSTDLITVTLQDALGRPTPGKLVQLAQIGNSVVQGPQPEFTDGSGRAQFTVTDTVQETISYAATDVSDGGLPVPGIATVNFNADGGDNCGVTNLGSPDISAGDGYAMTAFAAGFVPLVSNFGGLNNGCRGASGLAFDATGNLYVSDFHTGNIYRFGAAGGVADATTMVTPTPLGPGLQSLAFGQDGRLYGTMMATTGDFFTGAVIEIDAATGALVRTVAPAITCAGFVVTDPVGGDLFVDDSCAGGGSENGSIWRIADPAGSNPTVSVYAATPGVNGGMSFAPGGTLYLAAYRENAGAGGVDKVTGTTAASPGEITTVPGIVSPALGIAADGTQPNGDAATLTLATAPGTDAFGPGIRSIDVTTNPATSSSLLVNNAYSNVQVVGPDGCQYASAAVAVYRITNADGSCPLRAAHPLLALTPDNPVPTAQGGSQTFVATFHNPDGAPDTPVLFQVTGVNAQLRLVNTDASGTATLTYVGVDAGNDTVIAMATSGSSSLASNPARVTWTTGPHTTFLSMNDSPSGATAGSPVTLTASLVDIAIDPPAPIENATIAFEVNGHTCSGITDVSGNASCAVTVQAIGTFVLTADYAGDGNYRPATLAQSFRSFDQDIIFKDGFEAAP